MEATVLGYLQRYIGWRLRLVITVIIVLCVELIVSGMDLLLKGPVLQDDLVIALVAAGFVAPTFLFFLEYLLGEFAKQREHALKAEADKVLSDTQASYRLMFDKNADVMLVRRVSDLCITEVNEAFCKATGYSREQVIGKSTVELDAWHDNADRERMLAMLAQQGYCENVEANFVMSDGRRMLASVSAVTLLLQGEPHVVATIRDISARKAAEIGLQQSETLLRSTLESTDEGILMIAEDGHVLSANSRFLELWRVPPSLAAAGQDDLLLAHVLEQLCDPDAFIALVQSLYQSEAESRDTLHFKDGRVYARFSRALNIAGKRGRIWCFKDITEQAQAQVRLEEREEIFRSIVNCANDGIVLIEVETMRFVEFNDAVCRMSGYSREEFATLQVPDLQAEYDVVGVREKLQISVKIGESELESRHRRKDGQEYAVRISNRALRLHERDYVVAIISDIGERKRVEAELRIAAIAFESQEGMMITDAQKRLLKVNSAFTAITGYSSEEVLGKTPAMLSSGRHGSDFYRAMWQRINSNGFWEGEIWNKRKNGQIYPEHLTITAVTDQYGQVSHYVGTHTDTTERELYLKQLRLVTVDLEAANAQIEDERALLAERVEERTIQLQHANKAKDVFLATMSHEIRTPLGGMLGMMDLLSRSGLEGKQRELFEVAQSSGKNLLHIVDDILDWSKIEAGKLELVPRVASLAEVLKNIESTYSQVAAAKDIYLHRIWDERLSAAHLLDPMRVAQILNNFISNAIKFTQHGSIEISARLIARQDGSEEVRLSVKDTGMGIDAAQQERLFQQYEQANVDTARMYGGTGLGLAICRRLAEMMEGSLGLESELGKGSTFYLTLRLAVANTDAQKTMLKAKSEAASQSGEIEKLPLLPSGHAAAILVVDDHPVNRLLLKQQLELLGLQVECANSGGPALALWRDGRYDLVITDCHMPEMDGYELTRSIRDIERLDARPRMPVIAWTANVLSEEKQHCQAAGMDAILTKPTELADLRAKLLHWLAQDMSPSAEQSHAEQIAAESVIDMQILSKVAKRPVAKVAMLREFDVHNRHDVAHLRAALQDGNPATVVRSANRLKASSHMVGAMELVEVCNRIEGAVIKGDISAARRIGETTMPLTVQRLEAFIARFVDE
ncbi:MAG: PAS domain S-box protein [Gallionella sp.]